MIDSTLLPRIVFACIAVGAVCGIIAGFYLLQEKKSFFKIFYWRPKTTSALGWLPIDSNGRKTCTQGF